MIHSISGARAARRSSRPHGVVHPAEPQALLQAKLQRPEPGAQVLDRPRLLEALAEHADRPLTVITAEAGYGKTSLAAAWTRTLRRPVVWYSLMPSDADLALFGRYLLAGFRREMPRFGRSFERALEEARSGGRDAEMLAGTLVNELGALRGPTFLVVLDDFHEVMDYPPVVTFVESLLRHLPASVRLLVASRALPPVGVERMRARAQVFELHSGHLRFTRDELGRLFDEVYRRPLSESERTALEETTLGWPTAVHLVHEALRRAEGGSLEEVLASFRASQLELRDYLSSEVYARLDAGSRRLLERTAALARFDAALAEHLAGDPRARGTLETLVRRGLVRAFGSGDHVSYGCHELVRNFLRQELEARLGHAGWQALEGETADALLARGAPEPGLRHLIAAGRADQAAGVLREIAPLMLRQGRASSVLGFLAELPAEIPAEDLELALVRADVAQALGAWDEAEAHYTELLERARTRSAPRGVDPRAIECRALIGLGKVLNLRGRHEQVLGMAERGIAIARGLDVEIRARLLQMKAGAHFYLGQFKAAVDVLGQVRALLKSGANPELLAPTLHNLAIAYAAQGRTREALQEFRVALAQVRGTDSPRAPLYLSNLAFLHAELGELAEARRAAEEGLAAAQRFSNRAQECICQEALAQILAESGDLDAALAALRRAEELDAELRMEVIAADLLALRGRIFCARGEYRRAVEFLTQAIARSEGRVESPRLLDFQAELAWCELRAGRARVARDQLEALVARTDAGENDARRMRVHYWLAEALLTLGEKNVDEHLTLALRLARERGDLHFLRVQAREEPAPLLHALARRIEPDTVAAALVEAGAAVEAPLLALAAGGPPAVAEAAAAVLAEVGGRPSLDELERLAKSRRALQGAFRTARRHVAARIERGRAAAEAPGDGGFRLVLFGPPRLEAGQRPMPASSWQTQRAFQMLVYLALHPRGAGRDELIERFWPGRQAAAGRRNFHPTLSYVRRVLPARPESPILREGEFYRLNPDYPMTCDAWEFDAALDEARAGRDPGARREALARATTIAAAPFLEGLYANWADALQARLRDRVEKALLELGELCARDARFDAALEAFRRAGELDEYRESTRLAVIECLVKLGGRREAMVEYEKLKTLLRRELGVEPLPETEEGMQRLLRGDGVHGWPAASPVEVAQPVGQQPIARPAQARLKARRGDSA